MLALFEAAFHEVHLQRFGYADSGRPTEVVNLRVRATASTTPIDLPEGELAGEDDHDAFVGHHRLVAGKEEHTARLVDRSALQPGNAFSGPAVVVEYSTTTVVPARYLCRVDRWFNLMLERVAAGAGSRSGERRALGRSRRARSRRGRRRAE